MENKNIEITDSLVREVAEYLIKDALYNSNLENFNWTEEIGDFKDKFNLSDKQALSILEKIKDEEILEEIGSECIAEVDWEIEGGELCVNITFYLDYIPAMYDQEIEDVQINHDYSVDDHRVYDEDGDAYFPDDEEYWEIKEQQDDEEEEDDDEEEEDE